MKSKQYLSTICYSPSAETGFKLNELVKSNKLDFFALISHKAEEDEKKDHDHLIIFPNTAVDTRELDAYLKCVPNENGETFGTCGIWHTVGKKNVSDWILYVLHDVMYMRIKGYTDRKYTYSEYDFLSSNQDGMDNLVYDAYHTSTFTFNRRVLDLIIKSKDIKQTGKATSAIKWNISI